MFYHFLMKSIIFNGAYIHKVFLDQLWITLYILFRNVKEKTLQANLEMKIV